MIYSEPRAREVAAELTARLGTPHVAVLLPRRGWTVWTAEGLAAHKAAREAFKITA